MSISGVVDGGFVNMELENRGYMGKILYVDLTECSSRFQHLDEKVTYLLLGGKGLGLWLLYKLTEGGVDPLSPSNPLIFATGPLTGTIAPTSSKLCVVTKSPATKTLLDSYCGGFFASELKFTGYDCLVIKGRTERPVMVVIDRGEVDIKPAENLWGLTTAETESNVKRMLGEDFKVVCIGPAGERLSPISGIFSNMRCAGRGGAGAVMGSKNLKAIAVRGREPISVYDGERFKKAAWIAYRTLRMSESTARSMPTYGTANILLTINEMGALPTRNFQTGRFDRAEEISGESFRETLWKSDHACSLNCPIRCSKFALVESGTFKSVGVDGPDYETIFSLGSNCGVSDKQAICYANYLCDMYGIDTISAGCIVAFVMELYEKGEISKQELDGIEANWGDAEAMVKLVEKIAKCEGIGKFLQLGVREISKRYPNSKSYAMEVKGLEMPGYEPRAAQGMGLCYAISERGACHLRAYTAGTELCGHLGGIDPLSYDRVKVLHAIDRQDEKAVIDSAVLCFFTLFGLRLKEVYQMITSCTGFDYEDESELKVVGERIITLARLFNVREGFGRKDDTLPDRSLKTPLPEGPARGEIVHLEPMLNEYYKARGWDENGIPTLERIKELKLTEIL
ncbi:aldehyde ferredoxin oxidoreductase family protein [Candidatus Bathyarchaeota archaeon]|nr:aldehyde ferredoxin oxidoreductase family protein [Candidatus Bathyarchaeota archaeon]